MGGPFDYVAKKIIAQAESITTQPRQARGQKQGRPRPKNSPWSAQPRVESDPRPSSRHTSHRGYEPADSSAYMPSKKPDRRSHEPMYMADEPLKDSGSPRPVRSSSYYKVDTRERGGLHSSANSQREVENAHRLVPLSIHKLPAQPAATPDLNGVYNTGQVRPRYYSESVDSKSTIVTGNHVKRSRMNEPPIWSDARLQRSYAVPGQDKLSLYLNRSDEHIKTVQHIIQPAHPSVIALRRGLCRYISLVFLRLHVEYPPEKAAMLFGKFLNNDKELTKAAEAQKKYDIMFIGPFTSELRKHCEGMVGKRFAGDPTHVDLPEGDPLSCANALSKEMIRDGVYFINMRGRTSQDRGHALVAVVSSSPKEVYLMDPNGDHFGGVGASMGQMLYNNFTEFNYDKRQVDANLFFVPFDY